MSFSSDIKKELCDVRELSPQQAEAMLYGIMYASRMDEGRPLIQTENIDLMNAAAELIRAVFPNVRTGIVRLVKNSGSLYTLKIRSGWEDIAERFGDFSSISREAVSGGDEESGAFLRGVFVSCGSVTDPNKEYHLELVLPENDRTPALLDFIAEQGERAYRGLPDLYRRRKPLYGDNAGEDSQGFPQPCEPLGELRKREP